MALGAAGFAGAAFFDADFEAGFSAAAGFALAVAFGGAWETVSAFDAFAAGVFTVDLAAPLVAVAADLFAGSTTDAGALALAGAFFGGFAPATGAAGSGVVTGVALVAAEVLAASFLAGVFAATMGSITPAGASVIAAVVVVLGTTSTLGASLPGLPDFVGLATA